jgi:predicted helicase
MMQNLKRKWGAYYTPIPVVRYMVRAVDEILKKEFGLSKGLSDTSTITRVVKKHGSKVKETLHRVQILDPAVGTATFLNELVKYIFENNFKGQEGRWTKYVDDDLIPRLYGFELMMAPYTIAHLKLGMTLKELGYNKDFEKRLGIYLTNTLEEGVKRQLDLLTFGLQEAISKESQAAAEIKHDKPIMVIIGNPPYSGVSSNETEYANSLIQKYKVEPGGKQKLQERKHWLNDDYVKFIAFAEDMIEKNGDGVVAMITNHGYIDNPTFRGMRWHLKKTFNKIYILDLHGNSKRKEVSPDGSPDENVFSIQQGVAIILAIKSKQDNKIADVFHCDLFGKQKEKFSYLSKTDIFNSNWSDVKKDLDTFSNYDLRGEIEYMDGFKITDLFHTYSSGIVTMGDNFILSENKNQLEERLRSFLGSNINESELKNTYKLGKNYAKWAIENKSRIILDNNKIVPILYRPFDIKYTYFDNRLVWRHRKETMQHMYQKDNLGLVSARGTKNQNPDHFFISNLITETKLGESSTQSYLFPIYLFDNNGYKYPNFDQDIFNKIRDHINDSEIKAENVLDYIYAVLYSPNYRKKYKHFLKRDFPRVPYPKDEKIFWQLVKQGNKLRELHLMTDLELEKPITTYSVSGNDTVEKIEYKNEKVFINNEQYFGNVPEVAWSFYIGGYQPAQKWLKDRKNRTLSNEDIEHYQKIIKVLTRTDEIMKEIDQINFLD